MWISKKGLRKIERAAHDEGIAVGYELGKMMGQVEVYNKLKTRKHKTFMQLQIESIFDQIERRL